MVYTAEYVDLLSLATHNVPDNFLVDNCSVEDIWRMWFISKACLGLHVHELNIEQLTRVLRRKGFTLTPDRKMVIKIPSGTQHRRYEIVSVLRKALLERFIPQRVCDHVLTETTLGEKLMTTKHRITENLMYTGSLTCTCDQYPAFGSQKRHGHSFIPSWQYTGFSKATVQSTMKSVLTRADQ